MAFLRLFKNSRGSVLVLTIVILSTLAAAIMVSASRSTQRIKKISDLTRERQALYTAEAGIDYACYEVKRVKALEKETGIIKASDSLGDSLPLTIMDEVSLSYHPFSDSGLGYADVSSEIINGFLKVTSAGHYKRFNRTVSALLGTRLPEEFDAGLILTGEKKLKVEGGAVNGKVFMRSQPIPPGAFMEFELLTRDLPLFNEKLFADAMEKILEGAQSLDSGKAVIGELVSYNFRNRLKFDQDSLITHAGNVLINGDRFGQTLVIEGPGVIESGANIQLTGNVTLKNLTLVAQGELSCFDNARLEDCTLLSYKRVHLGNKTVFDGTIYSNGTLEIMNEAKVFPFATIYVAGKAKKQSNRVVLIDENVTVSGTIIASNASGVVYVGYESIFNGIIYTKGYVDVRGLVNGGVAAKGFLAKLDDAKSHSNMFIDGKIDRLSLPYNYAAPVGLLMEPSFEVVRWEVLD